MLWALILYLLNLYDINYHSLTRHSCLYFIFSLANGAVFGGFEIYATNSFSARQYEQRVDNTKLLISRARYETLKK